MDSEESHLGRMLSDGGGLKSFVRVLRLLEPADLKSCRQVSTYTLSRPFFRDGKNSTYEYQAPKIAYKMRILRHIAIRAKTA